MRTISLVHRYYDPATAQFLSVDPKLSETGEPYEYTNDDPVNDTDPTGDFSICSWARGGILDHLFLHCRASASPLAALQAKVHGIERQLREHEQKLQDYKNNPLENDNQGRLQRAIDEGDVQRLVQIYDSRIQKLQKSINDYRQQIAKQQELDGLDSGGELDGG